jgi:light-regulated signal transduction histidine kinase (bacteriophytochrome)
VNIVVALSGVVVLLTLVATGILMLRGVIRPLARLRASTVVIGAGNLDHRIAITSRDEIGDLARAFDEMVEALRGSTVSRDELERANEVLQREIMERQRAEGELSQRTEQLSRSNRDLEQFACIASHDLQEPLRAVAGPLQLLQRRYQGQLDARADEYIRHALEGASRMLALIEDLLKFSRVGMSEEPFELTECGLALANALRNLNAAIQETGAQVTHDRLPTVRVISGPLTLLFQNLVGNAIKFRHKDSPVQIHVGAEAHRDAWLFRVEDNGIGIDPQYFERIFLIFQRLHTRRDYPGTGIGLALCKRIVEHHGGRIWVESEPGKGTTFFFTLPKGIVE